MVPLQQLLAKAIIATMAFGGVACLCPSAADAEVAPPEAHGHHGHGAASQDDAQAADCGHEDCETGCERTSAVPPDAAGSPSGKVLFQLDDVDMLPAGKFALAPPPDGFIRSGSSPHHARLPQETPVQRFDRLLD